MVEINIPTMIMQAGNFLLFFFLFNMILVRPMVKHLQERDGKIGSDHEQAREAADRTQALLEDYEAQMAEARSKASQAYRASQDEGMNAQRAKLDTARAEAQTQVEKAIADIQAEAGKARDQIKAEMEKIPGEIASKLLGRAV
jgi:F-type H+-transporting ATPase subunit b